MIGLGKIGSPYMCLNVTGWVFHFSYFLGIIGENYVEGCHVHRRN